MNEEHPYEARVLEALEEAGATDALVDAVAAFGTSEVPREPEALSRFLQGPLQDALFGRLHPASAERLVEDLAERLLEREPSNDAPTVPPPASEEMDAYDDLASGAIHTRETPAWGIARPSGDGPRLWILVSTDESLLDMARAAAPAGTEAIAPGTLAELRATLGRADDAAVVLDAAEPSVPFDGALAALTSEATQQVVLWRMDEEARGRLHAALPFTARWVALDAGVEVVDVVGLLRV